MTTDPRTGPLRVPDDVAFTEPWQARAYGVALHLVRSLGVPWELFREELMVAVGEAPERPYFESWVIALERFAAHHAAADADSLRVERAEVAGYRYAEDGVAVEVTPLADPTVVADLVAIGLNYHVEFVRTIDAADPSWRLRSIDLEGRTVGEVELDESMWQQRLDAALAPR